MCLFFLAGVILLALGGALGLCMAGRGRVFRGTRVPGSFEPSFFFPGVNLWHFFFAWQVCIYGTWLLYCVVGMIPCGSGSCVWTRSVAGDATELCVTLLALGTIHQ